MTYAWVVFLLLWIVTNAVEIELIDCDPPNFPRGGGYAPIEKFYLPGDVVHYYCDVETHIGGNYYRRCEDTGEWTGETPVCDAPSSFSSVTQTSTLDDDSTANMAIDGERTTCSSTARGSKGEWSGVFTDPGELIRVMLFLPTGQMSYEVVLVKPNGEEVSCGSKDTFIDRYDWTFHNCPGPRNQGASGLKIRSRTNEPLQICEIRAHVLVSPKCPDPHQRIENGLLVLDRKSAILSCREGYQKSPKDKLVCLRDGVWSRDRLYCEELPWENNPGPSFDRERENSDRKRGNSDKQRN